MASRNGFVPQVMGYWLKSALIASHAAFFKISGAGKSGYPWARFTASHSRATRVISRMTLSTKRSVRELWRRDRRPALLSWVGRIMRIMLLVLLRNRTGEAAIEILAIGARRWPDSFSAVICPSLQSGYAGLSEAC